jgi:hypothetical protein
MFMTSFSYLLWRSEALPAHTSPIIFMHLTLPGGAPRSRVALCLMARMRGPRRCMRVTRRRLALRISVGGRLLDALRVREKEED